MTFPRLYRALLATLAFELHGEVREAVAYLADEVPRWRRENQCYSCHNNGDGARALFAAMLAGEKVDRAVVDDTIAGLLKPADWEQKPLARVQYAAALHEAVRAGLVADSDALKRVAELVAKDQQPDGHWKVEEEKVTGAPATYGPVLGTALALRVMDAARMAEPAAKARHWLDSVKPDHPMDAGALLVAKPDAATAVELLLRTQAENGSWGNEAFDTAVAMLGLTRAGKGREAIQRGRSWLLRTQLSGGGWPPTTRPGGGNSYAEHISTSAWATMALLATR